MASELNRAAGNCPCCHRMDITHRVIIGVYERLTCRMCAESYRKTPGVEIKALTTRQLRNVGERAL